MSLKGWTKMTLPIIVTGGSAKSELGRSDIGKGKELLSPKQGEEWANLRRGGKPSLRGN